MGVTVSDPFMDQLHVGVGVQRYGYAMQGKARLIKKKVEVLRQNIAQSCQSMNVDIDQCFNTTQFLVGGTTKS